VLGCAGLRRSHDVERGNWVCSFHKSWGDCRDLPCVGNAEALRALKNRFPSWTIVLAVSVDSVLS